MNLNTLTAQYNEVMGTTLGFMIKSLRHPDRKYTVDAKLTNGKYVITRVDTEENFFVSGTEDRYDFTVGLNRIREIKAEKEELTAQLETLEDRLLVLDTELGVAMGDVG